MNIQEARPIVAGFVSGDYTPQEHEAFLGWIDGASAEELDLIIKEYEAMHERWALGEGPSAEWMREMEEKLDRSDRRGKVKRLYPKRKIAWMAAASVVLLSAGAYAWHAYQTIPGKQELDGKGAGTFRSQFSKQLSVPRGEQRQVLLADGSKVWMNSGSELRYPAVFSGSERVVELSGEAYFEIAKNTAEPFRVNAGNIQIEVLGTHFNIMAYEGEGVKATLLEGSVRVSQGSQSVVLQPGDQAEAGGSLAGNGIAIRLNRGVDPERVLAWKNGYMDFENDDLQTVLREVSRCYNVDIQYEAAIPAKHFSGKLARHENIAQIYHLLDSQKVHYRIQGKTIIVMP
jgi:ferric-dicitrate binding protein FerR (iron transport regulator)